MATVGEVSLELPTKITRSNLSRLVKADSASMFALLARVLAVVAVRFVFRSARRALIDSTKGQEVCPVEGCGESTAPGLMSFILQNGVRICSSCYTGRQQNSAWARNLSDEEYVREMACRRRLSQIQHCGIEGCGAEINRAKNSFHILRKAGIVLCNRCTKAKLSKFKWTLRLSEEEFVIEKAHRLAADKAKITTQTLCAVEMCGSELGPKNQFWLKMIVLYATNAIRVKRRSSIMVKLMNSFWLKGPIVLQK